MSYEIYKARQRLLLEAGLCYRCGRNPHEPDRKRCLECLKSERDRAGRPEAKARSHQAWQKAKDIVYAQYGGYRCKCCSETNPHFLTLDHVNNDGAAHRREIGKSPASIYRWLIQHNFPPIVQVLCGNCQLGKLRNNGVCPHSIN